MLLNTSVDYPSLFPLPFPYVRWLVSFVGCVRGVFQGVDFVWLSDRECQHLSPVKSLETILQHLHQLHNNIVTDTL